MRGQRAERGGCQPGHAQGCSGYRKDDGSGDGEEELEPGPGGWTLRGGQRSTATRRITRGGGRKAHRLQPHRERRRGGRVIQSWEGCPRPSAAGLSVREDDGPRGGGARKWALRGGTLQLRQRLNRTLSKKVNRARGEPVKHCGESRKEERRAGEDRVHPGDTGVSGVGALGRAAVVGNDAPRALTSAKPLSLLVPGAAADCGEAWGLPGSRENRR